MGDEDTFGLMADEWNRHEAEQVEKELDAEYHARRAMEDDASPERGSEEAYDR